MHALLRSLPLAMPGCSSCPALSHRPPSIASQGNHLSSDPCLRVCFQGLTGRHSHVPPACSSRAVPEAYILFSHNCLGMARTLESQVQPHSAILAARSFWGCSPALDIWGLYRACESLPVDQTSTATPFSYVLKIKFGVHTAIK